MEKYIGHDMKAGFARGFGDLKFGACGWGGFGKYFLGLLGLAAELGGLGLQG